VSEYERAQNVVHGDAAAQERMFMKMGAYGFSISVFGASGSKGQPRRDMYGVPRQKRCKQFELVSHIIGFTGNCVSPSGSEWLINLIPFADQDLLGHLLKHTPSIAYARLPQTVL
jgi:hypothetical protein